MAIVNEQKCDIPLIIITNLYNIRSMVTELQSQLLLTPPTISITILSWNQTTDILI